MNPGNAHEWPPVNPLDALLSREAESGYRPKVVIVAAHLCDIVAAVGGHLARWSTVGVVHTTRSPDCPDAARVVAELHADENLFLEHELQETPAHLREITHEVFEILQRLRPDIVLAQAYEGGDCDRDAAAFAVHHAVRELQKRPLLVEMTGWHAAGGMRALGEFLPRPGACKRISPLTPEEQKRKRELLALLPELHPRVLEADLQVEHFRMAPCYDFTRPPHPGPLYYEQAGARWTAERWCSEAARVIPELNANMAA